MKIKLDRKPCVIIGGGKISIKFFNDKPVRAVYDDSTNSWYFSVLDVIGVIRNEDNYEKRRNYWKYLKAKLKKNKSELVSATTQLKLEAKDGKKYSYYYEEE